MRDNEDAVVGNNALVPSSVHTAICVITLWPISGEKKRIHLIYQSMSLSETKNNNELI